MPYAPQPSPGAVGAHITPLAAAPTSWPQIACSAAVLPCRSPPHHGHRSFHSCVNLTLDCGEFIFDGGEIPPQIPGTAIDDVRKLRGVPLRFLSPTERWQ